MTPRGLRRLVPVLLGAALTAPPAAAQEPAAADPAATPNGNLTLGAASILFGPPHGASTRQDGVALGFRAAQRTSARFGTAVTLTWGLTDWDRAREWIDAGNDAGAWTTEKIRSVARWSQQGGDYQPLRLVGAVFAETFLVMTYVAVPACYAGSAGGATSHVQVDFTGTVHSGNGPIDLWAEGGVGAAGIPDQFLRWDGALGPVVGVGLDAGPLFLNGRVLWSPGELNTSDRADRQLFTASLTAGARY